MCHLHATEGQYEKIIISGIYTWNNIFNSLKMEVHIQGKFVDYTHNVHEHSHWTLTLSAERVWGEKFSLLLSWLT